jgi:L-fuculose-phosphate aldolase
MGRNIKMESEYRRDLIEVCRRMYQKGFVASNDGNVSIRLSENEILATPTGMSKGDISPDQLIKVNMKGDVVEGFLKPSSELKLHIHIYKSRPDVKSVVHAHPPISTGFAVAGIAIDQMAIPEVIASLGAVPLAPYATPSTDELAHSIDEFIGNCNAILLSNHGVVTVGPDVYSTYYTMERVEHSAYITWVAKSLGGEKRLSEENIEKLLGVRKRTEVSSSLSEPNKEEISSGNADYYEDEGKLAELITRAIVEAIKGKDEG